MEERFGIAAFRSRQQVLAFEQALRRAGVGASIVTTPRSIAVGCGLSVRFELADVQRVAAVYRAAQPANLIGFYQAQYDGHGHVTCRPLGIETGYSG